MLVTPLITWTILLRFNKFKELVALRKNISALTIPTRSEVSSAVKGLTTNSNYVSYSINYDGNEYFIIHALNSAEVALDGSYELEFDSYLVDGAISGTITGSINMGANQSVVLRKV